MAVKKLLLDDFFEEDQFSLIGINCAIEDYRLAFLINQVLEIRLNRNHEDVCFSKIHADFALFSYKDAQQYINYYLVANMCKVKQDQEKPSHSLFGDENFNTITHFLLPEYKKVNYLLKIEADFTCINEKQILNKLLKIKQVLTAYSIDVNTLKTKNNLIFN